LYLAIFIAVVVAYVDPFYISVLFIGIGFPVEPLKLRASVVVPQPDNFDLAAFKLEVVA